jgi:hypothetical protein
MRLWSSKMLNGIEVAVAKKIATQLGIDLLKNGLGSILRGRAEGRLQVFLSKLAEVYSADLENLREESIQQLLGKFDRDVNLQEALHLAIRAVAFGRSKSIGPRLAAWVLSKIESRGTVITAEEEIYFLASERLSDRDLLWFSSKFLSPPNRPEMPDGPETNESSDSRSNSFLIAHEIDQNPSGIVPALVSCGLVIEHSYGEEMKGKDVYSTYVSSFKIFAEFAKAIQILK